MPLASGLFIYPAQLNPNRTQPSFAPVSMLIQQAERWEIRHKR